MSFHCSLRLGHSTAGAGLSIRCKSGGAVGSPRVFTLQSKLLSGVRSLAIVQVSVLASSSAGNATLVATSRTRLLIDAGLSRKETFERLAASGVSPETLTAILITHEHTDHVGGLPAIAKKLDIPVYASRLTAPAIPWGEFTPRLELFQAGSTFIIGDIDVTSFTIPHDA